MLKAPNTRYTVSGKQAMLFMTVLWPTFSNSAQAVKISKMQMDTQTALGNVRDGEPIEMAELDGDGEHNFITSVGNNLENANAYTRMNSNGKNPHSVVINVGSSNPSIASNDPNQTPVSYNSIDGLDGDGEHNFVTLEQGHDSKTDLDSHGEHNFQTIHIDNPLHTAKSIPKKHYTKHLAVHDCTPVFENKKLIKLVTEFGEYIMKKKLGQGSFGYVFLAELNGVQFAIKQFKRELFQWNGRPDEIDILKGVSHPNIVEYKSALVAEDKSCYLVMEYVNHGTLAHLIRQATKSYPRIEQPIAYYKSANNDAWSWGKNDHDNIVVKFNDEEKPVQYANGEYHAYLRGGDAKWTARAPSKKFNAESPPPELIWIAQGSEPIVWSRQDDVYFEKADIIDWTQQLFSGLKCLHDRKIIHRDLKPENILVHKDGDKYILKIADFGLAKQVETTTRCTSAFGGTLSYMSPEQRDGQQYNVKTDVWSVGCMLYELCTFNVAFARGGQFWGDIPKIPVTKSNNLKDLSDVCLKMLDRQVDTRPTSTEMLHFFSSYDDQLRNTSLKTPNSCFNPRWKIGCYALALAGIVAGGTYAGLSGDAASDPPAPPNTIIDLSTLTSPYTGTTVGNADEITLRCGSDGPEQGFIYTLLPGEFFTVTQTASTFQSKFQLSGSGNYPGVLDLGCMDFDDTNPVTLFSDPNGDRAVPVDLFFVVDAANGDSGEFTIEWTIEAQGGLAATTTRDITNK